MCETGNPRIFPHLRIPRSTTASWLSRGRRSVVSLDGQHDIASVLDENEKLKRRAQRQTAIIRVLVVVFKVSGFRLDEQRLPDGMAKAKILRAVDRCKDALPLKSALRLVHPRQPVITLGSKPTNVASSMTGRAAPALIQPNSLPPR